MPALNKAYRTVLVKILSVTFLDLKDDFESSENHAWGSLPVVAT